MPIAGRSTISNRRSLSTVYVRRIETTTVPAWPKSPSCRVKQAGDAGPAPVELPRAGPGALGEDPEQLPSPQHTGRGVQRGATGVTSRAVDGDHAHVRKEVLGLPVVEVLGLADERDAPRQHGHEEHRVEEGDVVPMANHEGRGLHADHQVVPIQVHLVAACIRPQDGIVARLVALHLNEVCLSSMRHHGAEKPAAQNLCATDLARAHAGRDEGDAEASCVHDSFLRELRRTAVPARALPPDRAFLRAIEDPRPDRRRAPRHRTLRTTASR